MSNSPLVNYTHLSACYGNYDGYGNKTPGRAGGRISKITIHHTAGVSSVEGLGEVFAPLSRGGSANYGIGNDGRIGMYVEEKNRAWTSSSAENDNTAVTIEVSNDKVGGDWTVGEAAMKSLIALCADICRRNDIPRLNYTGDTKGNLTMHKWFAATACPGPYLESKFPYIADAVNNILKESDEMTDIEKKEFAALKDKVGELEKRVGDHHDQIGVKWAYVDKNLPAWAAPSVKKAVAKGIIKGNENNSFELSRLMLRLIVMLDRAGVFGK